MPDSDHQEHSPRTTESDRIIGERLRHARLTKALTQDELAKTLGISFQQVQKYENGSNRVSASRLYRIAGVLGVPVTYFYDALTEDESPRMEPPPGVTGKRYLPDRVIRVARELSNIPDGPVRDALFSLIKVMGRHLHEMPKAGEREATAG